jgi:hypothetical protein
MYIQNILVVRYTFCIQGAGDMANKLHVIIAVVAPRLITCGLHVD